MKERIEKIMELEQLSASRFADAIGVQRSNISHILSGRNKPSLELVNKILDHFGEINADWLLLGKGAMVSGDEKPVKEDEKSVKANSYAFEGNSQDENGAPHPVRIVVFYSDNSFEEFEPK